MAMIAQKKHHLDFIIRDAASFSMSEYRICVNLRYWINNMDWKHVY